MAAPLATALEGLSGYRPIYPASDDLAARNPVLYSHLKLQMGGRAVHVLSRIADFGMDYSQRANKLAHHVVLDKSERSPVGPATLITAPGVMRDDWDGEPKVVALKSIKPVPSPPTGVCQAWQRLAGDAGWAGVLAESFLHDPERLVILTFSPGQEILPLFAEALSLLPPERRWEVTFSTYFTGLAPATTCIWRALVHDSKEAHESLRFVNALRLNLTSGSLGLATGGPLVDAARSGICLYPASQNATSPTAKGDEVFSEFADSQIEFAADESESRGPLAAAPPQLPSRTAASPAAHVTNTSPQPRKRRTLADVLEAESDRPTRTRLWIALTVAVLTITATLGLAFATGRLQFVLSKLRPAPNSKGLNGNTPSATMTAVVIAPHPGGNPVPNTPPPTPLPARAPEAGDAEPSPPMKDADLAETTSDVAPADRINPAQAAAPASENLDASPALANGKRPTETTKTQFVALPKKDSHQALLLNYNLPAGIELNNSLLMSEQHLPRIVLLKPSWLSYDDHEANLTDWNEHRAYRHFGLHIENDFIPFARFTATAPSPGVARYKIVSLNDDHVRWMSWYRVQIDSRNPNEDPKVLAFCELPLDHTTLPRKLNPTGNPVRWPLPRSAAMEKDKLPKLVLDRLAVSIGGNPYSLPVPHRNSESSWSLEVEPFIEDAVARLGESAGDASQIGVGISITKDSTGGAFEISFSGAREFVDTTRANINRFVSHTISKVTTSLGYVGIETKSQVEKHILALKSAPNDTRTKIHHIEDKIFAAIRAIRRTQDKNTELLSKIDSLESELRSMNTHFDQIVEFRKVEKSLENIEITSARIYYVLSGTGDDSSLSVEVDVVNFGDDPAGDAKLGEDGK